MRRTYEGRGDDEARPHTDADRRRVNSHASRAAVEFDAFRRGLLEEQSPVSGPERSNWLAKVMELSDLVCPSEEVRIRKPGLATRLFSAEIALPGVSDETLPDLVKRLDEVWGTLCPEGLSWMSNSYPDRRDMYWEVAVQAPEGYMTASVKLRTASFYVEAKGPRADQPPREAGEEGQEDRPPRREGYSRDRGDRPSYGGGDRGGFNRDRGDRPSYGGGDRGGFNRDRGDRPSYGGGDRGGFNRDRGDRPSYGGGDRGGFNRDRGDRPSYGGGDRGGFNQDRGDRPSYGDRGDRGGFNRDRGDRPSYGGGDRGGFNRDRGDRPSYGGGGDREGGEKRDRPSEGTPKPDGFRKSGPPKGAKFGSAKFKKSGPPDWAKRKKQK